MSIPSATTRRPAKKTTVAEPVRRRSTDPRAMPMIGVDNGAMIMAPITVAVESVRTPPPAMIAASVSIVQNADLLDVVSPEARTRSRVNSSNVRRCDAGRTRARSCLIMTPNNHDRPGSHG